MLSADSFWLFQRMDTKNSIFKSGATLENVHFVSIRCFLATRENTAFGVHCWNKNRSYTEVVKFCVSIYA